MSETRTLIVETAERMFRDLSESTVVDAAEKGEWPAALWNAVAEAGLDRAAVPEELGGAGTDLADGLAVIRVAGRFATPIPLAESIIAGILLSRVGAEVPEGPLTVATTRKLVLEKSGKGWNLSGTAAQVPWAGQSKGIVVLASNGSDDYLACVDPGACGIEAGRSIAGEPSDTVNFDGVKLVADDVCPASEGANKEAILVLGAVVRSLQMAGALETILELSAGYSTDRVQFGRPIAKFQAVQQSLAVVASEVSAAGMAAEIAMEAVGGGSWLEVAVAKARVGEAAGKAAELAHQVHGAIGFTHEYNLHHFTRRLWAWRDDFGGEPYWEGRIGDSIAKAGADELWGIISGTREAS